MRSGETDASVPAMLRGGPNLQSWHGQDSYKTSALYREPMREAPDMRIPTVDDPKSSGKIERSLNGIGNGEDEHDDSSGSHARMKRTTAAIFFSNSFSDRNLLQGRERPFHVSTGCIGESPGLVQSEPVVMAPYRSIDLPRSRMFMSARSKLFEHCSLRDINLLGPALGNFIDCSIVEDFPRKNVGVSPSYGNYSMCPPDEPGSNVQLQHHSPSISRLNLKFPNLCTDAANQVAQNKLVFYSHQEQPDETKGKISRRGSHSRRSGPDRPMSRRLLSKTPASDCFIDPSSRGGQPPADGMHSHDKQLHDPSTGATRCTTPTSTPRFHQNLKAISRAHQKRHLIASSSSLNLPRRRAHLPDRSSSDIVNATCRSQDRPMPFKDRSSLCGLLTPKRDFAKFTPQLNTDSSDEPCDSQRASELCEMLPQPYKDLPYDRDPFDVLACMDAQRPFKRTENDEMIGHISKRRMSSVSTPSDLTQSSFFDDTALPSPPASIYSNKSQTADPPKSNIFRATLDDEEMAASALVSMYDTSFQAIHTSDHMTNSSSKKKRVIKALKPPLPSKRASKSKNKTVTSLCYECGIEQTSHFRPVVSDFVG